MHPAKDVYWVESGEFQTVKEEEVDDKFYNFPGTWIGVELFTEVLPEISLIEA